MCNRTYFYKTVKISIINTSYFYKKVKISMFYALNVPYFYVDKPTP